MNSACFPFNEYDSESRARCSVLLAMWLSLVNVIKDWLAAAIIDEIGYCRKENNSTDNLYSLVLNLIAFLALEYNIVCSYHVSNRISMIHMFSSSILLFSFRGYLFHFFNLMSFRVFFNSILHTRNARVDVSCM